MNSNCQTLSFFNDVWRQKQVFGFPILTLSVHFTVEDIPKEWDNKWKTVDVYPDLFLPDPNIFIAKDTEQKILDSKDIQSLPTKLVCSIAILLHFIAIFLKLYYYYDAILLYF